MRPCGCAGFAGQHRQACETSKTNTAPSLAELKRQWHERATQLPSVDWTPKARFAIRKKRVAQTNSS